MSGGGNVLSPVSIEINVHVTVAQLNPAIQKAYGTMPLKDESNRA